MELNNLTPATGSVRDKKEKAVARARAGVELPHVVIKELNPDPVIS
jgi:hypothetical protein